MMSDSRSILVVNPGSTSTKVAIAQGDNLIKRETFRHSVEELAQAPRIWDQFQFRLEQCKQWTAEHIQTCSAVISLGGLIRPVHGGVYRVNESMLNDARSNLQGEHASNLGCALAVELAKSYHAEAFVADPVSVDEFEPLAYYSGHPQIKRKSLSHALNIHAACRKAANELQISIEQSSFVIAHLGGAISIAPVRGGAIIDVNDASSEGPFSPERTGGLPLQQFISLCFSQGYTEPQLRKMVMGKGGLTAYLGTNSLVEIEQRISNGDTVAKDVLQAMAYQIAKGIGELATAVQGNVDRIIITGGIAYSKMMTDWIKANVEFIAPVQIVPGESELEALAYGALRVLNGEEKAYELI